MNVNITETAEHIAYTVIDPGSTTEAMLTGMFYRCQDGRYSKSFPRERLMFPHDLPQMERNYNAYVLRELQPERRPIADLALALEWIAAEFQHAQIDWWLTGSAALYVRGIEVHPHDIDVMTFKTEIAKIRNVVFPYIVEPFHHVQGWVVKGFGVVDYHYRIDVAFEPEDWVDGQEPLDFGPYAQQHLETVLWQGFSIKVPPLVLHLRSNELRGRQDRVEQIAKHLLQFNKEV
jgi:hypothetical protein